MPADIVSKLRFEVKGDEWAVKGEDEVAKEYGKATLKVDATAKPRLIDFRIGEGSEKGAEIEGIYEWNGADEIKICAKVIGKERPSEFASAENSRTVLMVLQRQKSKTKRRDRAGTKARSRPTAPRTGGLAMSADGRPRRRCL